MLKHINRVLNIIIGSTIGIFMGRGIYVYWDYKTHSELYIMQSAPWYTIILVYGVFSVITLLICVTIKFVIRYTHK